MDPSQREENSLPLLRYDMLEFRPEWQFDDPDSGAYYHSGVVVNKLFFTSLGGDIEYEVAEKALAFVRKLFSDGVLRDCEYIRIADYSGVSKATINSRILYANTLNKLTEEYNCRPSVTYICGASVLLKTMLRIFSHIVSQRFFFVDSVDEAFRRINAHEMSGCVVSSESLVVTRKEIDEFAALCGHLLFEDTNVKSFSRDYISEDHPLNELYKIIGVLHNDLGELKQKEKDQKKRLEEALFEARSLNQKLIDEKRNVEENERVQQELIDTLKKARVEAESANKAKSEFLANISHEIRTPLHAVIGMTELLLESSLAKDQQYYADTISSSAHLLLLLINDLLDFSRIEAGYIDQEKEDFDMRRLIGDIMSLMKDSASRKRLLLDSRVDERLSFCLTGYPGYLRQVLMNLIQNAVKFTYKGMVSLHVTLLSETPEHVSLEFSVKDTGVGIAEEQLKVIFHRFTQIDASSTRKEGGTGLGLAIVKQLVTFMGGEVSVDSRQGEGSDFRFSLTFDKAGEAKADQSSADLSCRQKDGFRSSRSVDDIIRPHRILLVEDNVINQKVAQAMIEKIGYEIDIAVNGEEAVEALQQKQYGLVLMDLQMPVMDGFEATRRIRKFGGLALNARVPVVAMTANATREDRELCLRAGMDDYLSKPVERQVLLDMLQRWLPFKDEPGVET